MKETQSLFNEFDVKIFNIMDVCCPCRSHRCKKPNWTSNNPEIVKLGEEMKDLHSWYEATSSSLVKKTRNKLKRKLNCSIAKLKRDYCTDMIRKSINKGKTAWNNINTKTKNKSKTAWKIINTETKDLLFPLIESLVANDKVVKTPYEMADAFNSYFAHKTKSYPTFMFQDEALAILKNNIPKPSTIWSD